MSSIVGPAEVAYRVARMLLCNVFVLETASKEPFIVQEQSG